MYMIVKLYLKLSQSSRGQEFLSSDWSKGSTQFNLPQNECQLKQK